MANDESESRVLRPAGISYLRIPANDAHETAAFYQRVFGWTVDTTRPDPSRRRHRACDRPLHPRSAAAGEAGIRPYIHAESIDDTPQQVSAHGGEVVEAPYPEGDLWVATFRDPAGNVLGVWKHGPRA